MVDEFEKEARGDLYNTIMTQVIAYQWSNEMSDWPPWVMNAYQSGVILSDGTGKYYAKVNVDGCGIQNQGVFALDEGSYLTIDRNATYRLWSAEFFEEEYERA